MDDTKPNAPRANPADAAEGESKYRQLLDEISDLVQSVDAQGRILYANKAMLATLGYAAEELVGRTVFEVIAPESREHCRAAMGRMMSGDSCGDIDAVFLAKSGERVLVTGKAVCQFENGRPVCTRAVFRDVTAQRRAERRLAAQLSANKALVESTTWRECLIGVAHGIGRALEWSGACVWEIDPETGTMFCSYLWTPSGKSTPFTRARRMSRTVKGEGAPGKVWREGRPLWSAAEAAEDSGFATTAAFPVLLGGEVQGVVEFFDAAAVAPEAELLELFESVGRQLGEFLSQRNADDALRRTLRELSDLKTALDASALVSMTDAAGKIVGVNDKFIEVSGYAREELIGRTHKIVNSGLHPKEFFREMWETIQSGRVWKGEVRNKAKDGSFYWVDMTIAPFLGEDGVPFRYIAIRHVVTQVKLAAQEASAARARLQAVLDHATQVAIISCDVEGKVTLFNKGAENLLGYAAREASGKSVLAFHDPGELKARGELLSIESGRETRGLDALTELARGGGFDAREWTCSRKDGSTFPAHVTVTASRGRDAEIDGYLMVAVDATQAKAAQKALADARDAAMELARAKAEFLANMSHEIRTPMNAVIGMTGLLLDTPLSPQQKEFAETIRSAGESLLTIIGDILDFSKIEAGKMPLETLDFDPRQVLEDVAMLFAARAQEKGLEIAAFAHDALPDRLRGDAGRLRQILSNLTGNAVKFTSAGEVTVRARLLSEQDGDCRVRFEVRDTGIGLDEAARAKLFTAFTQADSSTTRKYGGTGLGLAISKRLVELMGGSIGIDSAPGRGSTFWFEAQLPRGERVEPARLPDVEGSRVLIVDDNATNRQILSQQTASWLMEPRAVSDATQALDELLSASAEGRPYRLALVDMQMPGMDGAAFARAARARPELAGLKMILLSSLGLAFGRPELDALGFAASLTKPVRKSSLFDAISDALSARSDAPAEHAAHAPAFTPPPAWGGLRVLLAEDNLVNQKIALLQLKKLGCRADAVADGREAARSAAAIPYDLVLMDCQMPEMDGFEATSLIRRRSSPGARRPVIVAMTANALEGDRERCLAAGMDDYVSKPVRLEALAAAIARWYPSVDQKTLDGLLDLARENADAVRELAEQFVVDSAARVAALRAAALARDAAELERQAHALKGGAGSVGAAGAGLLAAKIESAARERRLGEAAELVELLDEELREAGRTFSRALTRADAPARGA